MVAVAEVVLVVQVPDVRDDALFLRGAQELEVPLAQLLRLGSLLLLGVAVQDVVLALEIGWFKPQGS